MSEINFSLDDEQQAIVAAMMETAATKAIDGYVKRQKDIDINRRDRRYQNTELILKNYYTLKKHIEDSVDYETPEFAEIFGVDVDEKDKIFLSSVFRTVRRTKTMMDHVDNCLENYKKICYSNNKESEIRKYRIIEVLYLIQDKEASKDSWDNIAAELNISKGTLSNDRKKAIKEISALIFGIDSLGIY